MFLVIFQKSDCGYRGFTCPLKPRHSLSHISPAILTCICSHRPPRPPFSPCPCVCLTRSPCFDSIADVVQSHGGVFMDSSYPSSPVMGPLSRGQRRASEVSIASQVSGMADNYTATSIANSKCLNTNDLLSLHSHTIWSSPSLFLFFQFSPSLLFLILINLTLNTPCTQPRAS